MGHEQGRATVVGMIAVLMWATLALLTAQTGRVPPFLLVGLSFTLAFGVGAVFWLGQPSGGRSLTARVLSQIRLPFRIWVLGVGGLFGYHFFYFVALRNAPPVEASLIAYLWPLLIVIFSTFLPDERLRWWHVIGTIAGLIGTIVLVTGGGYFLQERIRTGLRGCARLCTDVVRLLGAVPRCSSYTEHRRRRFLRDHRTAELRRALCLGNHHLACRRGRMACRARVGSRSRRGSVLSMGSRRQAWGYPRSRGFLVRCTAAFHNLVDCRRVGRGDVAGRSRLSFDHRRRVIGRTRPAAHKAIRRPTAP